MKEINMKEINIKYLKELKVYLNILSGFTMSLHQNTTIIIKLLGVSLVFSNTPGTFLFKSYIEKFVYIIFCYKYLIWLSKLQTTQKCLNIYNSRKILFVKLYEFNLIYIAIFIITNFTNILSSFTKKILFNIIEKIFEITTIYILYHLSEYVNQNIYAKLYDYHKRNIYYEKGSTLISDYRFNIIRTQKEYENYKLKKLLTSINQDMEIYIKLTNDLEKYITYTFCCYICSQIYFPFIGLYIYNLDHILLIHININKLLYKITM